MRRKTCWWQCQGMIARSWCPHYLFVMCVCSRVSPHSVLVFALSTGQPHPLSANGGVLYLGPSRRHFLGNSKHETSGDFLGMITQSSDVLDDRLFIWNWKTGII